MARIMSAERVHETATTRGEGLPSGMEKSRTFY
jgi:hypothetical protein